MTASDTTTCKCLRCGRALTSAKSIALGYGPTCGAKIRQAAKAADLADFKPAQQAKAIELIEQGGILRTKRPNLFTAVSSDGTVTYLVAASGCTCKAGARGVRCYHTAAAQILLAA